MQGRGGRYGRANNNWQSQQQHYGYSNYQQYPYGSGSGYAQGQYQQQGQYGSYQQGYPPSQYGHFPPPPGPSYPPRSNARGGGTNSGSSSIRGNRNQFNNMSWKAGDGRRPAQEEMLSVVATPAIAPSADDEDNPFRPPKDLRAEDEEVERERRRAQEEAEAQAALAKKEPVIPTGPSEKNNKGKISFSIKPRPRPTDTGQTTQKLDTSPTLAKRNPITDSPLNKSTAPKAKALDNGEGLDSVISTSKIEPRPSAPASAAAAAPAPAPAPKTRLVKKKVLKAKPTLSEEHARSDSVYYRKTGNESVVGSGTYGKVYKATHVYTGKMVALKKIRMEGERDGFPVTAIREIKLLQSLRHRNVVPLREVMVEHNDCYMVFEYLHHDLTGLLNHPSFVLTPAHKKHLAKQMFEGLEYLHRRGVLHRDIKAANILVSNKGELKLADFGLARFYQKHSKEDYTNRVITIWYRSPELLLGETQYDGAVDIWSAACVLVEIFLRHAIFPGNGSEIDQLDKIWSVLGTPSRSEWPGIVDLQWFELLRPAHKLESTFAAKFRQKVSPQAFELLRAMFCYDPAKRPTAAEVLAHAYFVTEDPAPAQVVELEQVEGDWHEFESKQLRKEKEKQERKRRERERDNEKRKRDDEEAATATAAADGASGAEAKKVKVAE